MKQQLIGAALALTLVGVYGAATGAQAPAAPTPFPPPDREGHSAA